MGNKKLYKIITCLVMTFVMISTFSLPLSSFAAYDAMVDYSNGSNDLPSNYIDDSNDDIYTLLNGETTEQPALYSRAISNSTYSNEKNVNVDLAFVIDTTGSMSSAIRNVKNNITTFATYLEEKGVSLRVAIIEYRDIT